TLEDAILAETRTLLRNVEKLNESLVTITEPDMARLIEQLRRMEKDLLPIYTFFKTAVYTTNK
ncbi:hypothetical protein K501DRAFT_146989, partial [Backusella circina FSU 941]